MIRAIAATVALLALHTGCSNSSKKDSKRVEKDDASATSDGGAAATVAQIVALFHEAVACAPHCPAADRLRAVMRAQPADAAAAAIALMADPDSKTDAGVGQEALLYLDDWLGTAVDPEVLRRTSEALQRVIATGSTNMRTTAYTILSERHLPDAQRILVAEAENPARDVGERSAAGTALGAVLDDFSLIERWLGDDQPAHWLAGLNAMATFDPDGNERRAAEERALTIALGKRADLPGDVVTELAFYYEIYLKDDPNDREVRALAERWSKHPDDQAAGQMRKILVGYPATTR